jgi:hypothetical protein
MLRPMLVEDWLSHEESVDEGIVKEKRAGFASLKEFGRCFDLVVL